MKTAALRLALVATWLCASTAFAGEPRIGKFVKYDAGDYVIVTSRGPKQAKRIVENLPKIRATLERVLGVNAVRSPFPTTILIAGTSDWNQWIKPRFYTSGHFQRASFAYYIAINGTVPIGEDLSGVFHEYTHYFLASQFSGEYPPWFNEGLGEVMGNARFTSDTAILQIDPRRLTDARAANWIPFNQLLRIDSDDPRYLRHKWGNAFYAQSWLTIHFGMVEDRAFGRRILEYLNQLQARVPQEEAARKAFGDDLSLVDKQLRDYLLSTPHHPGHIKLGLLPAVNLPSGQPLTEFDAIATIANVALESDLPLDRVRPLVNSMEKRDPNVARAAIFSARLAQRMDDNAAFDRAVARAEAALTAGDWPLRRELASVLLSNGRDGPMKTRTSEALDSDIQRALKWSGDAIRWNNQDIEALWIYGTAATRLGIDLDRAGQALANAYQRAPRSPEIARSLAELKTRQTP
jgi:hypothetical protein